MGAITTVMLFGLLLLALGGYAQFIPQPIFTTAEHGTAVAVGAIGGPAACGASFFIVYDNSLGSRCLAIANSSYDIVSSEVCDSAFTGVTALACLDNACFMLNPTQKTIIVLNNNSTISTSFSISELQLPSTIVAYQQSSTFAELLLVDASNNSIWHYTISYSTPLTVSLRFIPYVPPGVVAGIFMDSSSSFIVASKEATNITRYSLTNNKTEDISTSFENIQLLSGDMYNNIHVYDAAHERIQILDSTTGLVKATINLTGIIPIYIAESRTKIFIITTLGIIKYEEVLNVTSFSSTILCSSTTSTIVAHIEGGDYPLSVWLFPDIINRTLNASSTIILNTTILPSTFRSAFPVLLLDEDEGRSLGMLTEQQSRPGYGFVNNTIFPAYHGSKCYRFFLSSTNFYIGSPISLNPLAASQFPAVQYEYFEFWINIGAGGQIFNIVVMNMGYIIPSSGLQNNTWTQIRIHIPTVYYYTGRSTLVFSGLEFRDVLRQPGQNFIYIDYMRLIPYEVQQPDRLLYIFDKCSILSTHVVPVTNTSFSINVSSSSISCEPTSTITTNRSSDGTLFIEETYGQRPFLYNWTLFNTTTTTNTISNLPPMATFITIYENSLNNSWKDASQAINYSLNNTQYFHSAPSSIAFQPTADSEAIIFSLQSTINRADFPTIEFWVNGGEHGGQTLYVAFLQSTDTSINTKGKIQNSIGLVEIPPNRWVKGSFTIPITSRAGTYTMIQFVSDTIETSPIRNPQQPTLYFDDIKLIGNTVVTVTDATGCKVATNLAQVTSPPPVTHHITISNVKCYNSHNGMVSVQMTGGTPPYFFSWSTSIENTEYLLSNMTESLVYVNATDSNGCKFETYSALVLQPPVLKMNTTITQPLCHSGTGQISAIAYGGIGVYTYTWYSSTGVFTIIPQSTPDAIFQDSLISGLSFDNIEPICYGTGLHMNFTISPSYSGYCSLLLQFGTNASIAKINGCSHCFSPQKYSSVMFWIYSDNETILQSLSIALIQQQIIKSNEIPLHSLATLHANKWNKVVFDLNQLNLTNPDGITFITTLDEIMGRVIVDDIVIFPIIANGFGYSAISGYESTIAATSSTYFLSIVDDNGCSISSNIILSQPTAIQIVYNSTVPSGNNINDGTIAVLVTGGSPPYLYHWLETNETFANIANLAAGIYTLNVIDSNGCSATLIATVPPYVRIGAIRQFNTGLSGGLAALVSIGLLICLFSMLMLLRYWSSFSLLGSFLSSMILTGCISSFTSAVVLLPKPTDKLCTAFPWLLGIGFVLVYGCLFIKTWALYRVWRKAIHYQKAALTPTYIMKCLGFALLIESIFLIIWTLIDPPKVHLIKVVNDDFEYQCDTDKITFWIIFLVGKGLWLIFGAVLSILTRNVVKEYNESSSIAYAIYNNVLLGAIAIPLAILIKEIPGGRLIVEVVIITVAFSFTMVIIFYRIWHSIMLPDKIHLPHGKNSGSIRSKGASSTTKASKSGSGSASGTDSSH